MTALLTPAQVAARIGKASGRKPHASTVVRWIVRGARGRKLPAIRQGGNWLVSAADADAFVRVVNTTPGSELALARDVFVGAQLTALLGSKWRDRRPEGSPVVKVDVRRGKPATVTDEGGAT